MESLDLLALTLNTGIFIPLIAAVGGTAVGGGCELALACDIVYTTKHASFALPEVRLGLLAAGGGVRRLPGAVGAARAANLLLTGKAWSGAEAVSWGMAIEACDTWKDCLNVRKPITAPIAFSLTSAVKITVRLQLTVVEQSRLTVSKRSELRR